MSEAGSVIHLLEYQKFGRRTVCRACEHQRYTAKKGKIKMKKVKNIIRIGFFFVILIMIVFPPYAGLDTKSNGQIHVFMGYYPIWDLPTNKDVYDALIINDKIKQDDNVQNNKISEDEFSQYVSIFNKVRFIFNLILLTLIYSIVSITLFFVRKKLKSV